MSGSDKRRIGEAHAVQQIIRHEKYYHATLGNDIALIKVYRKNQKHEIHDDLVNKI